jgi:cell fate regulator YaaT (PSP1 superfamily)
MAHLIEVAFRGNRKEFVLWEGETAPPLRAAVIVEADRGEDLGRVHATGELAEVRCRGCAHGCGTATPAKRALRLATPEDVRRDRQHDADNQAARREAIARVKAAGLHMKVTDAEWQWDRRKLTFYFTAERRVDFRALVRELAQHFHARIELRQIGVRDEAKRLSGIGRCGREYCSASWMAEVRPVNLGVAKDQRLSLNPQQISGACGRLMCCLRHEHDFYVQSRRRFPKEGKLLRTAAGEEKVVACDIFNERVTLRGADGELRVVPLADLKAEIEAAGGTAAAEPALAVTAERPVARTAEHPVGRPRDADDPPLADEEAEPELAPPLTYTVELPVSAPVASTVASIGAETGAQAGAQPATPDGAVPVAGTEPPRKRRRRGRRGGRRQREAEQRRRGASAELPAAEPDHAAGDDGDDGDDSDDAPEGA